ncbi:histone deacetylase family protein [Anabaena subtropica]|uniref:Histone deacetylase n=1 Tax=Anabaena subtropica FACHB-260 TaxID=2692884 RepID=A0ABR8CXS5_9NOST|nr:histone deacetylase [Anabaena subtropica]MBD2347255.1 histone deacetylase [Anabaena subtropica FACHB-260]
MFPVFYSDEFLDHKTGKYHPESPERLTAIINALKQAAFAEKIRWIEPTPVLDNSSVMPLLVKVHSPGYINKVREIATTGGGYLDGDTPISPRSYDVALLAVSAWLNGMDAVLESANPAFVLARPPGHHAESDAGMGFCLFSNAAIAAYYALEQPGINRVAIVDWDVHHGNGTQAIVETNSQIAYCSLHQYPCYPGTGRATERGFHSNVLNLPVPPGSDISVYQPLWEKKVIPFLASFQADLLIVSAGYDGNAEDPLASVNLQPNDYGLFTHYCLGITSKILFGLEGGYDLDTLSQSVLATVSSCLV